MIPDKLTQLIREKSNIADLNKNNQWADLGFSRKGADIQKIFENFIFLGRAN